MTVVFFDAALRPKGTCLPARQFRYNVKARSLASPLERFSRAGDPPRARLETGLALPQFHRPLFLGQPSLDRRLPSQRFLFLTLGTTHGHGILLGEEALFFTCSAGHLRLTK